MAAHTLLSSSVAVIAILHPNWSMSHIFAFAPPQLENSRLTSEVDELTRRLAATPPPPPVPSPPSQVPQVHATSTLVFGTYICLAGVVSLWEVPVRPFCVAEPRCVWGLCAAGRGSGGAGVPAGGGTRVGATGQTRAAHRRTQTGRHVSPFPRHGAHMTAVAYAARLTGLVLGVAAVAPVQWSGRGGGRGAQEGGPARRPDQAARTQLQVRPWSPQHIAKQNRQRPFLCSSVIVYVS